MPIPTFWPLLLSNDIYWKNEFHALNNDNKEERTSKLDSTMPPQSRAQNWWGGELKRLIFIKESITEDQVTQAPSCCCQPANTAKNDAKAAVASAQSVGSIIVSFLLAFFPKCPVCWAAYMSMFGSFSLSNLPYQGWMYPVLLSFLGLHLYLVFRRRAQKGYGPFLISLLGASILIAIRLLSIDSEITLYLGMGCILIGSLWNSFRLPALFNTQFSHQQNP